MYDPSDNMLGSVCPAGKRFDLQRMFDSMAIVCDDGEDDDDDEDDNDDDVEYAV